MMATRIGIITAFVAIALTFSSPAEAITSCSFSSTASVSFGGYDVFSNTALDTLGSLTFSCQDIGASDTIIINLSRGSSASFAPRTLLHGGWSLGYNLYLDAARTSLWGDGTSGTSHYGPLVPANGNTTLNVYGRIPARQNVGAGAYADTIVATIVF